MDVKRYELSEVSAASAGTLRQVESVSNDKHRAPATDLLKEIDHAAGRA